MNIEDVFWPVSLANRLSLGFVGNAVKNRHVESRSVIPGESPRVRLPAHLPAQRLHSAPGLCRIQLRTAVTETKSQSPIPTPTC